MNARFFTFISTLLKWQVYRWTHPYGVLGNAPNLGLRKVIELVPVFTSSKQRRKRKFTVVFVQVVKKSALRRRLSFHQIYRCTLLKIPSINELLSRFSGNRHLGGEKKKSVVLEKSAFQRSKQSWIEANCALKIIIFRYFAFLFRINFLFFIIYSFYILFEHDFFRYARAYRAYRQLRPWDW